ncbi:hypothetical protein RSOLAG22IIIB_08983 [Rhizoctonia solani]|uniref:Uncharacterized protein n=1 Tax=Rhizoctonia solani TaxID=456999 RepID=A0A0K6FWN9_9AGAM|nr:hypothetical protein RSOLAG22IIIB_08983 [Rhizoctonia solani]
MPFWRHLVMECLMSMRIGNSARSLTYRTPNENITTSIVLNAGTFTIRGGILLAAWNFQQPNRAVPPEQQHNASYWLNKLSFLSIGQAADEDLSRILGTFDNVNRAIAHFNRTLRDPEDDHERIIATGLGNGESSPVHCWKEVIGAKNVAEIDPDKLKAYEGGGMLLQDIISYCKELYLVDKEKTIILENNEGKYFAFAVADYFPAKASEEPPNNEYAVVILHAIEVDLNKGL